MPECKALAWQYYVYEHLDTTATGLLLLRYLNSLIVLVSCLINAAVRRNEAANWLRRTVGVVCARDLAEEPSEEEFRVGLRNGIILCNAVNKIQPGTVPKVAFVSFGCLKFSVSVR
jgi:hypothetical protein